MDEYVEVEIELPAYAWEVLEFIAKRRCIEVNELINIILIMELDKMDAHEHLREKYSSEQVEGNDGAGQDKEEDSE